jgi:F0F1-type ATP synthase assembly protein I
MTQSDGDRPKPVHVQMVAGDHLRQGWDALATLFSGVLVFGLPAWWLSDVLQQMWILPVALVLGMGAGIAAVWVRYGVHRP